MKYKVLVVDDNVKNLQVVAALLSDNNYQVEVAISGEAALLWLENTVFDIILLDVMMPNVNGYETCKLIRDIPTKQHIPIIFLTALHDVDSITTGFRAGGVDYITKPFNSEELLARLGTHIELKVAKEKVQDMNKWLEHEVDKKTIELQHANEELKVANQELKMLDHSKSNFLKSISHEIRTPLNGIVGSVNLLQSFSEDPYFKEVIALLDLSVTNLERYSYSALQIANLQIRGDQSLGLQELDIVSLFKSCHIQMAEKAKQKNLCITFESSLPQAMVLADFTYLQNAINALLQSSITFTHEGYITLNVSEDSTHYLLIIEDSGILFSGSEISHFVDSIQDDNYQFERNNAIELHLANIIVQFHKGSMRFNNTNAGTQITISLPKLL